MSLIKNYTKQLINLSNVFDLNGDHKINLVVNLEILAIV